MYMYIYFSYKTALCQVKYYIAPCVYHLAELSAVY